MATLSPLLVLLLTPLVALVCLISQMPARQTAALAATFNLVFSLGLLITYPASGGSFEDGLNLPCAALPGLPPIHFHLGVDGISLPLLFLTTLLTFIAIASSPGTLPRAAGYYSCLLLISFSAIGALSVLDLFFFSLFLGGSLLPLFFLIGVWGGANRQFAAYRTVLTWALGGLLVTLGLIALVMALPPAERTFDWLELQHHLEAFPIPVGQREPISLLLLLGFSLLLPLFPFHSWAASGLAVAPPAAALLLSGVLSRLAFYGLLRFTLPVLYPSWEAIAPILYLLLTTHFFYLGFLALGPREVTARLAFLLVAQSGWPLLGLLSGNVLGITGAIVLIVAQGLSGALLLCLSGEIIRRTGENRLPELGRLAHRFPRLTTLFTLASFAQIGVPGFLNLVGIVTILFGLASAQLVPLAFVALLAGFLATIVQLGMVHRLFFRRAHLPKIDPSTPEPSNATVPSGDLTETAELTPPVVLLALSLLLGCVPHLILHLIEPSVAALPFLHHGR